MKKILFLSLLMFSMVVFGQDPISNLNDEAKYKIELNEKNIKSEKQEIEKHQKNLSVFQDENSKLKKILKTTPKLALNNETKDNAINDLKSKILINDDYIKNEKQEIVKHQKTLSDLQKENSNLKKAVKQIKKL